MRAELEVMGDFVLTNVLKKRGFIRGVFKSKKGIKITLDFADKYGQWNSTKGDIGKEFDAKWIMRYKLAQ